MKKILFVLMALLPLCAMAGKKQEDVSKYLAGAVPIKNGIVVFQKTYQVPGKSMGLIYSELKSFLQNTLSQNNSLEQSRLVEQDTINGILSAQMEEWTYFKRKAWVTDRARMFYQLYFRISDGQFSVEMHHIHYIYNEESQPNGGSAFTAEEWITDKEALSKDGKSLTRVGGKFRRNTIDRKNEIFSQAAKSVGAVIKTKKVTTVVEEEE